MRILTSPPMLRRAGCWPCVTSKAQPPVYHGRAWENREVFAFTAVNQPHELPATWGLVLPFPIDSPATPVYKILSCSEAGTVFVAAMRSAALSLFMRQGISNRKIYEKLELGVSRRKQTTGSLSNRKKRALFAKCVVCAPTLAEGSLVRFRTPPSCLQ
jgi:hypothetical protein